MFDNLTHNTKKCEIFELKTLPKMFFYIFYIIKLVHGFQNIKINFDKKIEIIQKYKRNKYFKNPTIIKQIRKLLF